MKKIFILLTVPLMVVYSCAEKKQEEKGETVDLAYYEETGENIANVSQKTLMENVKAAIEKGGTEYAVEFCNEKAMPLTDSLSQSHDVKISRITDKTRNPGNHLKSETDKEVFAHFADNSEVMSEVKEDAGKMVYYKRINLAMPTCIKCHGNPESDIDAKTLDIIRSKYPEDMATGYALNDFRALWKIEFEGK